LPSGYQRERKDEFRREGIRKEEESKKKKKKKKKKKEKKKRTHSCVLGDGFNRVVALAIQIDWSTLFCLHHEVIAEARGGERGKTGKSKQHDSHNRTPSEVFSEM